MANIIKLERAFIDKELSELAKAIKDKLDAEEVCTISKFEDKMILINVEAYYFRISGYVAMSILLTEEDRKQEALIVGFGGGDGMLNISSGANGNFAKKAKKLLIELGFEESENKVSYGL